jgi:hypothetical protein
MRPISFTRSQPAADADSIVSAQSLSVSGAITLDGVLVSNGVATLTVPAVLTATNAASYTINFVVTGTGPAGQSQVETLALTASGTVTGSLSFATVTGIVASAAAAETISIGNGVAGYTAWLPLDIYTPNQVTNISGKTSGTVNYSVEYTNEDPFDLSIQQLAVPHPAGSLTGASGDETHFTTTLMRAVRLKINSGDGSVRFTVVQQSTQ